MSNESERTEKIGCALDDIGDRLMASNSYLKVYYEPAHGFQIEVYRTDDPGHMRDTELNRIYAVIMDSGCLEDVFMALNKQLTISEQSGVDYGDGDDYTVVSIFGGDGSVVSILSNEG